MVRLALTRLAGNKGAPSLQIEYSMVGPAGEVLIRPFAAPCAGSAAARYRVAWHQAGRRFAVLASEVPARAPARLPRLPSGEYVLLACDRATAEPPSASQLKGTEWAIGTWVAAGAAQLPLREFELGPAMQSEYVGKTGGVVARGNQRERVLNLIVHANTQNLVPGRLARTPEVQVLQRQRAPAGRFEARLVDTGLPALLLAEGDAFPDQQWVIALPLPEERLLTVDGVAPRLVWSLDGRHVLLLTAPGKQAGFARLGRGREEVFLLFDVHEWQGTIAPPADLVGKLQLAQ